MTGLADMARSLIVCLLIAIIGAVGLLVALNYAVQSTSTYRYRLQLELDTPEGRKTGSSVIEVLVREVNWGTPESTGTSRSLKGEAVFIDMGGGRNLVATMTTGAQGEDEESRFERIAELAVQSATGKYPDPMKMSELTGAFEIPEVARPTLVTLSNVKDGFSARAVQTTQLASVFGQGFKFVSAKIVLTRDNPNYSIDKHLPFLDIQSKQIQHIYTDYPYVFKPQPFYFVRR